MSVAEATVVLPPLLRPSSHPSLPPTREMQASRTSLASKEVGEGSELEEADWLSSLPPRQRSCVNMGQLEPCVNKAVQVLLRLKEKLEEETERRTRTEKEGEIGGKRPSVPGERRRSKGIGGVSTIMWKKEEEDEKEEKERETASGVKRTSHHGSICIEGTATGTHMPKNIDQKNKESKDHKEKEKEGWGKGIQAVIELLFKLEADKQETARKLEEEEERERGLQLILDEKARERLDLLESAVQAEHDSCLRDTQELKWYIGYESRQLSKSKEHLKTTSSRNAQLKKDVAHLSETCPLLEGKISEEREKIKEIATQQEQKSEDLKKTKQKNVEVEEKLAQAQRRADAEKREQENELDSLRKKVKAANEDLTGAIAMEDNLRCKITDTQNSIAECKQQEKELEESIAQKKIQLSEIQSQVTVKEEEYARLVEKNRKLDRKREVQQANMEAEQNRLQDELNSHLEAQAAAVKKLREVRDMREQFEQDNDALREKIVACKKQQQDGVKALERGEKEMIRLDKQLKVSEDQYSNVRERNQHLNQRMKDEKMRMEEKEYSLKSTIEDLERQIQEHSTVKAEFEIKVTKGKKELERLNIEVAQEEEKLRIFTQESEQKTQEYEQKIALVESAVKKKSEEEDQLRKQLEEAMGEFEKVRKEMQAREEELERKNLEMTAELQAKREEERMLKEREELLTERLRELKKSLLMMDKIQREVKEDIEKLELQESELKEALAIKKAEQESWEKEHKEISDFAAEAEEKYQQYLEQRQQLLKDLKLQLGEALGSNADLSHQYRSLQSEYMLLKSRALEMMEGEMGLQAALTDLKQLHALQSQVSLTMKKYYQYRSCHYTQRLKHCQERSAESSKQLKALVTELQSTLSSVNESLRKENQMKPQPKKTVTFDI